ncbi:aminotransferase [Nitzschia inconspicua]|uniref:Branched-chain-amino-acid aminotransferase n=1 Tax=Nitzschia inconspicua TaxID=303405 RepID=A0A9K3PUC5_9STRA|nr:aminotransferase [Nitzschia inconspicua]
MALRHRQALSLHRSSSEFRSLRQWVATNSLSAQRSLQGVSSRFISSSHLTIEQKSDRSNWEHRPSKEDLKFGTTLSDHMLMIEWNVGKGWDTPKIVPYQDLRISPAASSLHYGLQCFEGMKAYRSLLDDNSIHLFRPDKNMERLSNSMHRLHMPGADFDPDELINCIGELVKVDKEWIPSGEGYSLYLRPTVIATHRFLGLAAPESVLLYVITSPVGPYYKTGFNPIKLTSDTHYVRAWPGGTGNAKVGGNYASTMKAAAEAAEEGYSQVLWLFGENDEVTEVGAMNFFVYLINKETQRPELVTAPLTRGDILPGVTRASILDLARSWGEFDVSERYITMGELKEASDDNRLLEAFGAGTAAVVTPVSCIQYKGEDIEIPAVGDLTQRVWDEITGIQYRTREAPSGWIVEL